MIIPLKNNNQYTNNNNNINYNNNEDMINPSLI